MEPIAVVTRNHYIESLHYGYICIVDAKGRLIYSLGNPETKVFFRSSAKPIQALSLIHSGAARAYGIGPKEIALACSSHSGEPKHQEVALEFLYKLGLGEEHLQCGIMEPYGEEERLRLAREKQWPTVLHCSCSGKHAAMLALAKHFQWPLENYYEIDHPLQQEILKVVSYFTNLRTQELALGIDGCGLPIYLLPIKNVALSYAKLMEASKDKKDPYHKACHEIMVAMTQHPDLVGGEGEFCTALMETTKGRLIAKIGCEAVYCIGIKESSLGICIKIGDGNERGLYPVVVEVLNQLGVLSEDELNRLWSWHNPAVHNNLKTVVGRIIPVIDLMQKHPKAYDLGQKIEKG